MKLKWVTPPPPARRGAQEIIKELQERPGEWAVVAVVKNTGHHVQKWKKYGCDATSRRINKDTIEIYARWPEPELPKLGGYYMTSRRARGVDKNGQGGRRV